MPFKIPVKKKGKKRDKRETPLSQQQKKKKEYLPLDECKTTVESAIRQKRNSDLKS